jgi:alkylation response protein AidB-like acyl-CoA dehydrogenase
MSTVSVPEAPFPPRTIKQLQSREHLITMSLYTPEQLEIQKAARKFVAKNITPRAAEYDKSGDFPEYLLELMKETKVCAMAIPREYGGLGYDSITQALVLEEWGYGCAGMGTTLGASMLGTDPMFVAGTEEQRKRFFATIVNGGLAAFGLTEPGAGSDAGAVKTTAVRDGDDYILNGTKCFITNGVCASIFVIIASTEPEKGMKGLSAFIVEKGRQGFTIGTAEHKLGIRSSNTVELHFKDVRVPVSNLIDKEGKGMKIAMKTLDMARPPVACATVGIARRAVDECMKYLMGRYSLQTLPRQTLLFKLADMQIQLESARQMAHHAMRLRDANCDFAMESAISKTLGGDMCMAVTSQAVSLMGSYGYTSVIEKLMRDAKIAQIYEGTNQIQRLVIVRGLFMQFAQLDQEVA